MSESTNYVFLNGKPVENAKESFHHVSPKHVYVGVFAALLVLTGVTYLVSYADLGPASLPVAMLVAVIKASLVVGFFMHLKYEDRVFAFMFLTSLIFVAIFFAVTLFDISKSGVVNTEASVEYKRTVDDNAEIWANPPVKTDGHADVEAGLDHAAEAEH